MNSGSTWCKLTLLAASSLTVMSGAAIAPALPRIAHAFEGAWRVELMTKLVLTLPALLIGLLAPVSGYVLDRLGRRPVLLGALGLYALAGSAGLWLSSLWAILLSRALLGVAVAGVMTAATTLIGDYFQGERRSRMVGLQAACMAGGGVVFLLASGGLAEIGWRWPFAIYLLSAALMPAVLLSLPEPNRAAQRKPRNDQSHADASLWTFLPAAYATGFLGMTLFYLVPTQAPFHLEQISGAGGAAVGAAIAMISLCGVVTSLLYGRIRPHLRPRTIFAILFAGIAAGYAIVALAGGYWTVVAGLTPVGLGIGLLLPNLNGWLLDRTPERLRGRAVGGLTAALFLGQFISPILVAPIIDAAGPAAAFAGAAAAAAVLAVAFASHLALRPIAASRSAAQREAEPSS